MLLSCEYKILVWTDCIQKKENSQLKYLSVDLNIEKEKYGLIGSL